MFENSCQHPTSRDPCSVTRRCKVTTDDYLDKIRCMLPRGMLWEIPDDKLDANAETCDVYPKFWGAVAASFAWMHNAMCSTIDEISPCTSEDNLERWAIIYDYPIDCLGVPETGDQLCKWLTLINHDCFGMNIWTLWALIDFAGITFVKDIREVQTLNGCTTPYKIDCETGECAGIDLCQPVSIPKVCKCAIHIELDDSFFDQDCVIQQQGECCFDICKPISYFPKLGLDCIIAKYFAITADIYIVDSTGTTSILLEPDTVCYT